MCPFPFSFFYATGGDNSGNPMPLPSVLFAGGRGHSPKGGDCLKVEITEREVAAIEHGLNKRGVSEVSVKVENGRIVVLQVEKKKIV